jgi:hypothetical protein
MNTTRLTNAPQTRQQLIADNGDHYDYDVLQTTPTTNREQQLDILGAPLKQDNLNNDVIIDIRPVNLSAQFEDLANNDDDDDFDPLDYDKPDKKLAAYDEALEKAYLDSIMARIENEANNPRPSFNDDEDLVQEFVEDDYDPLDYDRPDKTLAAYDEALERAYLANTFTIEYVEDDNEDDNDDINFEEESNDMLSFDEWQAKINAIAHEDDMLSFDEWQAKMFQDRQERSAEFFKSFDPEDMDYHEWLQEQKELHKDDPEFQYNLQLFTYNNCQNERLYATEDAAILDDDDWNYPITDSVILDHQVEETIEQLIVKLEAENAELFNNKQYHAISSSMPFRIGNENNV